MANLRKPNVEKVVGFDKDIVKFTYSILSDAESVAKVDIYEAIEKIVIKYKSYRMTIQATIMDSMIWKLKSPYLTISLRVVDNEDNLMMSTSNLSPIASTQIAKMVEEYLEAQNKVISKQNYKGIESIISKF